VALPSHLERPIREVINLNVLTCQFIRQITSFEDDLPAVIGESELLANVTLFAMAQDVGQTRCLHVQDAVHVQGFCGGQGKLLVEVLHEPWQKGVAGIHVTDVGKAQLLHETILKRAVRSLNTALGWLELAHRISDADAGCTRIRKIPGIGPVVATAIVAAIGNGAAFRKGREFAAWLGIVPRHYSTGGNAPPFAWQLTNIRNYVGLSSVDAQPITIGGNSSNSPGHGSGMRGVPGDSTPPSRFIRLLFQKQFATQPASSTDASNLALHLLNTVDIPLGTSAAQNEQKPSKGNDDYTQWVVVKALTARTFSYRTAANPTLMQINFDELDLGDAREEAYSMPQEATYINVTEQLSHVKAGSR
jgi:Linear amide C-N hydrolases, choloylglycine hydrolase family/Transposase IS116/IS110/IS902 family